MVKDGHKKEPITSFGIILFFIDPDGKMQYLVAQRRDTIEYTEFIRGRYTASTLPDYLCLMSRDERQRLSENTFDELWDDLWVNHNSKFYRDMKPKAKQKYLDHKDLIDEYLKSTVSNIDEPRWGFPKGKKNARETEIQCAYREFKEESRLTIDYLNLLNLPPSREIFKGSNGKMYSTIYYIAQVDYKIPIRKIATEGIRVETISEEISNLAWLRLDDAVKVLPPWRKKLLIETDQKIREFKKDNSLNM